MSIKLLHTADWQLGKPFSRFEGDVGAVLREARFEAVRSLAELAAREELDAVLVAGDILDTEHAGPLLLRRMVAQLQPFTGPWLLLPGNHDPARPGGLWDRFLGSGDCPANVHILCEPVPSSLLDGRLILLPAPLRQKHSAGDPTAWFETAERPVAAVTVGLAHGGMPALLPESADGTNPIAKDRAERAGLDYLALGDWHSCRQIGPRSWYSGTPEPDDFTHSGLGEALIVTLSGPGAPAQVERQRTGRYIWVHRRLALGRDADADAIEDQLAAELDGLATPRQTVLRLSVGGHVDLAARRALDEALARRSAVLRHLETDLAELATTPSEADIADFAAEPLLAEVAARLTASGEPTAPLALRLLYTEWQQLERR